MRLSGVGRYPSCTLPHICGETLECLHSSFPGEGCPIPQWGIWAFHHCAESGVGRCPSRTPPHICGETLGCPHSPRKGCILFLNGVHGYPWGFLWYLVGYSSRPIKVSFQRNFSLFVLRLLHGGILQIIYFGGVIKYDIQPKDDYPPTQYNARP